MSELVKIEFEQHGIARIVLNDPATRNAMSEAMAEQFAAAVQSLGLRSDLRVVVLTGAGESFSGGGHLDMLFAKTQLAPDENQSRMELFYSQFLSLRELPVPVVAALNGHAVGAGLCLALACDLRLANEPSKFGVNFVHLGLHPGMGATKLLPEVVGAAWAAELLFTGRIITASEAVRIGLVHHMYSPDAFQDQVLHVVQNIAQAGPQAVRALKRSLRLSREDSLAACLKREAECQARSYASSEFLEGITAAREKRKPRFGAV